MNLRPEEKYLMEEHNINWFELENPLDYYWWIEKVEYWRDFVQHHSGGFIPAPCAAELLSRADQVLKILKAEFDKLFSERYKKHLDR